MTGTLARPSALTRSRYNYFVHRDDGWVGYNARLGTLAALADDVVHALRSDGPLDQIREPEKLVELGFVHYGDELDQIFRGYEAVRRNDALHLTIAPSLDCNFSCSYCYQNSYRNNRVMSPEIEDATLSFIRGRLSSGRKKVVLEWYGGEPLLAKDIVLRLTPRIRTVVEEEGGTFERIAMVTNGSLLDERSAAELAEVGVSEVQISFDSLTYVHGEKRGVLDDDGRPSPILANILTARPHLDVTIRINVSPANRTDIDAIVATLREYGLGDTFYLARVDDFDNGASATAPSAGEGMRALPRVQLPIAAIQTTNEAHRGSSPPTTIPRGPYAKLEREVLAGSQRLQHFVSKLIPKKHFCSATTGAMFVIDADGDISRCWESAGVPDQAIGNVLQLDNPDDRGSTVEAKWNAYNPLEYSACASCRVLPLCMGGCSYPRVLLGDSNPQCTSIKSQVSQCVDEIGRRLVVDAR